MRLDTWWRSPRALLRPDVAVYRAEDEPADRRGAFRVPPQAVLEILSEDTHHDLVRKDGVYAKFGVARRAYLDPAERYGWWWRADDTDHREPVVSWPSTAGPSCGSTAAGCCWPRRPRLTAGQQPVACASARHTWCMRSDPSLVIRSVSSATDPSRGCRG